MSKFIEVHDKERFPKGSPNGEVVRLRKSSIDAIVQRKTYTTLYIHGIYLHVFETADWVQNQCEGER